MSASRDLAYCGAAGGDAALLSSSRSVMRLLALLAVLTLAACTGPGGADTSEPAPEGQWRGTLVPVSVSGRSLPATLSIRGGTASLVAGSSRSSGDDAALKGGRLTFSVERFPVTPTRRRTLRCSLREVGPVSWDGTCRAGTATYGLRLTRSGS